jgi:D-xylulose reductase
MLASGKVDLKPLISETFPFEQSIQAFERAAEGRPTDGKLQIRVFWADRFSRGQGADLPGLA